MIIAALAGIKVLQPEVLLCASRSGTYLRYFCRFHYGTGKYQCHCCLCGAKSILDLGLTTEYLETFGVPLIGYQTKALPALFCRTSPFEVSIRLDSAREIARAMAVKRQTGLNGGPVVANPIPEQFAMPEETINGN